MNQPKPAGWYVDPQDASQLRWWDSNQWTAQTQPAQETPGVQSAAAATVPNQPNFGAPSQPNFGGPGVGTPNQPNAGAPGFGANQPNFGSPGAGAPYQPQFGGPGFAGATKTKKIPVIGLAMAAVGLLMMFFGSFLPWISLSVLGSERSFSGTELDDGKLTVGLAIVGALFLIGPALGKRFFAIGTAIFAGISLLAAIIDISSVEDEAAALGSSVSVSIGFGLWMVLLGSLLGLVGAIIAIANK